MRIKTPSGDAFMNYLVDEKGNVNEAFRSFVENCLVMVVLPDGRIALFENLEKGETVNVETASSCLVFTSEEIISLFEAIKEGRETPLLQIQYLEEGNVILRKGEDEVHTNQVNLDLYLKGVRMGGFDPILNRFSNLEVERV